MGAAFKPSSGSIFLDTGKKNNTYSFMHFPHRHLMAPVITLPHNIGPKVIPGNQNAESSYHPKPETSAISANQIN